MIVTMQKLQIIGPRSRLDAAIDTLQDLGTLHLSSVRPVPPLASPDATPRQRRHVRTVQTALEDIEAARTSLGVSPDRSAPPATVAVEPVPREVRMARRARRAAHRLAGALRTVQDERAELARLADQLEAFRDLESTDGGPGRRIAYVVLGREHRGALDALGDALSESLGEGFALRTHPLDDGEVAVIVSVPLAQADRLDTLLPEVGVREIDLPIDVDRSTPGAAADALRSRLAALDERIANLETRRRKLAAWLSPGLSRARAALHDWLIAEEARGLAAVTRHLFVLEGWIPDDARDPLARALRERVDPTIVVEEIATEHWSAPEVPVAIRNPPLFRPFELITRRLPSPRYGSLDPTPFVAVFFPVFFGLILGDIGYGTILVGLALLGWRRSRPDTTLRAVSQIGATCGIFAILFGVFFGEFFGDLGHRWFGLRAMSFQREQAVVPFLILAVSIGFVHVVLGLVLGAISSLRSAPRHSFGRGLTALMLVITAALLLAAIDVLPAAFFKPSVIALLLSFPVLILLEGFVGPIEFLSRVGHILSYARIMALGTASVMMAAVANQMVGRMGGAVVGVLFATLFHLVNFGLGVFSPTVHALRLHFVEFFGTFYSPGDQVYRPLRHWRSGEGSTVEST